jgi:hypothetical protein
MSDYYGDTHRALQDQFDSRRLADTVDNKEDATLFRPKGKHLHKDEFANSQFLALNI